MRINIKQLTLLLVFVVFKISFANAYVTQIPEGAVDKVSDKITKTHHMTIQDTRGDFHIEFHFNQKHWEFVQRVIDILKKDAPGLIKYFDHSPKVPLHILINGAVNQSNGSATSFPKLVINLYDYPPVGMGHLNISGDWIRNLVVHELVHVLHHSQINGVNSVFETLFGIGRLMPMIVPRWFSEGIAVWAETLYTNSGRLRNPLYHWETNRTFILDDFCHGAGCVDNPGQYPYRQYPYWAGAFFMQSLEQEKSGAIKCLIHQNSSNIPFFLNSAFAACLDRSAEASYRIFHMEMEESVIQQREKLKKSGKTLDYSYFDLKQKGLSLQAGLSLKGNKLITVIMEEKDRKVQSYDLDQRSVTTYEPKDLIKNLMVVNQKVILSSNAYYGDAPHNFYQLDLLNKTEKALKTKKSYLYFLPLEKRTIGFAYGHHRWRAFEQTPKDEKKDKQIYIFPKHWQIYQPLDIGKEVYIPFYHALEKRYGVSRFDLKSNSLYEVVHSFPIGKKDLIYDRFTCGDDIYLRSNKNLFRLNRNGLSQAQNKIFLDKAIQRVSENYEVALFKKDTTRIYYQGSSCKSFALKHNLKRVQKLSNKKIESTTQKKLNKTLSEIKLNDVGNYYSMTNQSINYWFLGFNIDDNLLNASFDTSFSDPGGILSFDLRGVRYFELEENGYDVSSFYNITGNWYAGLGSSKSYSYTGYTDKTSFTEGLNFQVQYSSKQISRYSYTPFIFAAKGKRNDFISNREVQNVGLTHHLEKSAKKFNELIPRMSLTASHVWQDTKSRTSFFKESYALDFTLKYHPKVSQHFYSTYSKMHKTDFGSGILYGGRYNEIEVLGVETNDLFGNEIITGRTQVDFSLEKFFQKNSLFPIYTREIHLLLGAEWFKSDIGIIDDKIFGRNNWYSGHAGVRLQSTLGYLLPLDIDFLYASTIDPSDKVTTAFVTTIKATWWP